MKPCCARISGDYNDYACGNRGKVERDGKPYCLIHDPVRIKARREKEHKEYNKQQAERQARRIDKIKTTLLNYKSPYLRIDPDGTNEGLPLIDMLSHPNDPTIKTGVQEIDALTRHIYDNL